MAGRAAAAVGFAQIASCAGKSILYKVTLGTDLPEGSIPAARMYRKGADGVFRQIGSFTLHRRANSQEVALARDALLDGLTPGDYRADFYIGDGSRGFGFRRGGTYAGAQRIHIGRSKGSGP